MTVAVEDLVKDVGMDINDRHPERTGEMHTEKVKVFMGIKQLIRVDQVPRLRQEKCLHG